jgi:hypothetical protein
MNINLIIELKKEYMCQLTYILTPSIYEGLYAIYNDAKATSSGTTVLKDFQSRLKIIKAWKNETIQNEVNRILNSTNGSRLTIDLIQAVFKVNQIILGVEVPSQLMSEITPTTFIHHVYIECSREFWMNPYLFYHEYTPLEIKQNNNIIMSKISCAIENAIRRLLPMGIILDKFLGDKSINSKEININEIYNMPLLYEIDLTKIEVSNKESTNEVSKNEVSKQDLNGTKLNPANNKYIVNPPSHILENNRTSIRNTNQHDNLNSSTSIDIGGSSIKHKLRGGSSIKHNSYLNSSDVPKKNNSKKGGSAISSDTNNRILNIINNQELKLSDSNDIVKQFIELSPQNKNSRKTSKKDDSSSILKNIINDSMKGGNSVVNSNTINSNMRNQLLKNLESESESVYKPNEKYQDIFSNSEIRKDTVKIEGTQDARTKDKFFNNYLNI